MMANRDANYLAEAATLKLDASPIDSDAVLELISRLAQSPPDVLERMKTLLSSQGAP